jgi:hypothetical protein
MFGLWLAAVLAATWSGEPGVVFITPMGWLLALVVGIDCVGPVANSQPTYHLREAALAGGCLGFLQGILFWIIVSRLDVEAGEQSSLTRLSLTMVVVGMLVGAGLAMFTAYLASRRRAA